MSKVFDQDKVHVLEVLRTRLSDGQRKPLAKMNHPSSISDNSVFELKDILDFTPTVFL